MRIKNKIGFPKHSLEQIKRTFSLVVLWAVIAIIFGFFYFSIPGGLIDSRTGQNINQLADSIYFSFVTISTVGYGDIYALGFARFLTAIEGLVGWILFGIIVYRIVSYKQDVIIKEIHNLSNEQYLSKVRNSLFVSNTNLVRFTKDVHSKKISFDSSAYELSIISTTLRSNIEDARRFLCRNKNFAVEDIPNDEIFLLLKVINLGIANLINSLSVVPRDSFTREPSLYDNILKIIEAGKGIYNYCNVRLESKRIDELKMLYMKLEKYTGGYGE